MENLDDFMKKKMLDDERRFEFREEYWQQAERLIEADERRKRRRGLFWWWSAGLFVLTLAAGVWVWQQSARQVVQQNNTAPVKPELSRPDASGQARGLGNSAGNAERLAPAEQVGSDRTATQPAPPRTGVETTPTQTIPFPDAAAHNPARSANELSDRRSVSSGAAGKSAPTQHTPAKPFTERPAPDLTHQAIAPPDNSAVRTPAPDVPAAPSYARPPFAPFDRLPALLLPLAPVSPRWKTPEPVNSPPVARRIEPVAEKRLSFGLSAFGSAFWPAASTQWAGAGAGLTAGWRFRSPWSVQTGVTWRVRAMGDFPEAWGPQNSTQLRYSFGYESAESSLESSASHWLEIPLGLQWQHGPWRAQAGVATGFLLGIHGYSTSARESSLTARVTERQRVSFEKTPFYNNYVAVFAGGEYRFGRRLGAGLRLHYQGGDFRRPANDFEPPRQTFWLDAGLKWRIR